MISLLIYILVMLIVLAVIYYMINTLAPEPIRRFAIVILVVIAAIFLIYLLMGYGPMLAGPHPRRLP
jgi:cytochrome c biogenesis factor